MMGNPGRGKRAKIVYYSGTGGAQRAAQCFEKSFREKGYEVSMQRLTAETVDDDGEYDLLVVVYAVHACNAPEPVYRWIEDSHKVDNIPAAVVSVSGGGEVSPNTACRKGCIRRLGKKGYEVIYEEMLVMPSNWIASTKEPLALMLLEVLPQKVASIAEDIDKGVKRRSKPLGIDRFFSALGELEKPCARMFGRIIKVSGECAGCGWCSKNCPAGNITMEGDRPHFGGKCQLCLGCIYGCPSKALKPIFFKFIIVKEGYSLKELEKKLPLSYEVDVEELAKGYLWSGIRKYLL